MARFVDIIPKILEREGGYVDDPLDQGGETKYGISKRAYPDLDIKNLTLDQASSIYRKDYWAFIRGDDIEAQDVAARLLDIAVNQGPNRAIIFLQRALNTLTEDDLKVDGFIGPITLSSLNSVPSTEIKYLVRLLEHAQIALYRKIVERNPSQRRFLKGWLNRILEE